jgi:hypothetical protein
MRGGIMGLVWPESALSAAPDWRTPVFAPYGPQSERTGGIMAIEQRSVVVTGVSTGIGWGLLPE